MHAAQPQDWSHGTSLRCEEFEGEWCSRTCDEGEDEDEGEGEGRDKNKISESAQGGENCRSLHRNTYITTVQVRIVVKNTKFFVKNYKNITASFITTVLYEPSLYGVVEFEFCISVKFN